MAAPAYWLPSHPWLFALTFHIQSALSNLPYLLIWIPAPMGKPGLLLPQCFCLGHAASPSGLFSAWNTLPSRLQGLLPHPLQVLLRYHLLSKASWTTYLKQATSSPGISSSLFYLLYGLYVHKTFSILYLFTVSPHHPSLEWGLLSVLVCFGPCCYTRNKE